MVAGLALSDGSDKFHRLNVQCGLTSGRDPVGKEYLVCSQRWSVAPMCPAFLLGANTDGLHAIRKANSLSLARARSAIGTGGFC